MKKQFLALMCILVVGAAGAQTVRKAATAPDRPAQSAKADVYVQDRTAITTSDVAEPKTVATKKSRKKKGCGGHCCKKS